MIKAGDTYLCPSIEGGYDHPYFVLLDPDENGFTVVVNATSVQLYKHDKTTFIDKGEHTSITHGSLVYYRGAEIILASTIDQLIEKGDVKLGYKCSPKLLEKIQRGILTSDYTTKGVQQYFQGRLAPKTKP